MRTARCGLPLLALAAVTTAPAADFLEGRVWDSSGSERRPLAKALITVNQEGRGPGPSMTRSDAEGRWRIAGPFGARYYVNASRPGYFVAKADGAASASVLVDCKVSCGPVDFELQRGGVVSGVVEDDQGEPLQNVRVSLQSESGAAASDDSRGFGPGPWPGGPSPMRGRFDGDDRTDDLGRFRASGLRPGRYKVIAETYGPPGVPRYEQPQPEAVEIKAREELDVRIVLRRNEATGLTISGVVTGVDLSRGRNLLHVYPAVGRASSRSRFGRPIWGLREDGSFELTGLAPGKYYFAYSHSSDGGAPRQVQLGSLELRDNLAGVRLSPVPALQVSGRFQLERDGEPRTADALLVPVVDGPSVPLYAAASETEFHQSGVYPGLYRVRARSRDWYLAGVQLRGEPADPDNLSITSDLDGLVIVLSDRFARIEGRIRTAKPSGAAPRFLVTLTSKGDESAESRPTDQNGGFLFERLVPGDYSICARPSDARPDSPCSLERAFPVEAGAQIELALTLPQ